VVGLLALIANGARQSAGGDFQLTVYQGEEVLGGQEIAFSEVFNQGKPVVLNFWAGLCPPCRAEMPGFQRVHEELGDDFILLGLDVGPFMNLGSNRDARTLLEKLNITYPTARAHNRTPVVQFGVFSMPTTIFFTPDKQIFRTWEGFLDQGRMSSFVQELIDASKTAATSGGPAITGTQG
jgi:thiol-disulfide isomerase/thioredoxin